MSTIIFLPVSPVSPSGIIEYLKLREPIYTKTTNYGHFGKEDLEWEKISALKGE